MNQTNTLNINKLKANNILNRQISANKLPHWVDIVDVASTHELFNYYAQICQQYSHEKKWILLVNPTDDSVEMLAHEHNVDVSKILRVNTKKYAMNFSHIEKVLRKGNCSAIVFCDTAFLQSQISQLNTNAQYSNTQCIMLKTPTRLH
ncbi:hypothetical protein AAD001_09100 [Colwelliaceae bacterium 6471]